MPSGQEVVAGLTNSTGLVLCGADPPSPTNLTLWCTKVDTLLYFHSIGDGALRQGISDNQALKHATIFRLFDLTHLTKLASQRELVAAGVGVALGGGVQLQMLSDKKGDTGCTEANR